MLSFIPTINCSYSDWIFSERIWSIWWFKYFISSGWDYLIILKIRAECEPTFKDWRKKVVEWFFFIKSTFSISILSSSLRIWLDLSNGLEWESLDWIFIFFKAFFRRITILLTAFRLTPNKIGMIYMSIKYGNVNGS